MPRDGVESKSSWLRLAFDRNSRSLKLEILDFWWHVPEVQWETSMRNSRTVCTTLRLGGLSQPRATPVMKYRLSHVYLAALPCFLDHPAVCVGSKCKPKVIDMAVRCCRYVLFSTNRT